MAKITSSNINNFLNTKHKTQKLQWHRKRNLRKSQHQKQLLKKLQPKRRLQKSQPQAKKSALKKLKNPHQYLKQDSAESKPNKSSAVRVLPLYFPWDLSTAKLAGCPYTAISIITGEDPFLLRKIYKNQVGLSPIVMSNHFVQLGFDVQQITKDYLYKLIYEGKVINDAHVILASVRMTREESSWVVFHGGTMWHNYVGMATSFSTSMSFPVEYSYKIYTPEWDKCGIKKMGLIKFPEIDHKDLEE